MEQFVLGIFQEQLSKFLVGFRKEQVNANLLNGKGEIRDVNINCSVINNLISKVTPFIILESIRVSKLSFNVTSWTNIKKAPICVVVEDVFVTIVEPLSYVDESQRLKCRQMSREEFKKMMEGKKARGPYNVFDRILDNLQIEIRSVNISFQTMGKFKTKRRGPWTPPQLNLSLRHLKYRSVDEFGNEANPDECWQHNKNTGRVSDRAFLIYKRVSMDMRLSFEDHDKGILSELVYDSHVDVHLIFSKKVSNGALLGIQIDAIMKTIEINIDQDTIPILAHAIAGLQYCMAKNRAFNDPLRHADSKDGATSDKIEVEHTQRTALGKESEIEDFDDKVSALGFDDSFHGNMSTDKTIDNIHDTENSIEKSQNTGIGKVPVSDSRRRQETVLVLPSGIVIHNKVSISFSIQDCRVKGNYSRNGRDYIQLQTKGLVAEFIWPKTTREKGGYIQMSIASLTVRETYGKKVNTILRGGTCNDFWSGPIEMSKEETPLVSRDENFPLFEDRSIQPDPLSLRHSFPSQAFGYKATINFIHKVSEPNKDEILVENEIGVDQFHITVDSQPWCRAVRFGLNEDGGGFDPRWHTGDWADCLSVNAMINPLEPLILSDHCQVIDQIFLDDNEFISSDLFNITARISRLSMELPAFVERDIMSCNMLLELEELMIMVSSALPRTFLTGRIGSSIRGDRKEGDKDIHFPNDPSDICYFLQGAEDPLIRQHGTETSRKVSTFRSQITTRGLAIKITPVIPYCNATEPQELLSPLDMTMIICFEGEPPVTPDSDLIKIVIFTSMQIHRLNLNFDVDLIAGGISTVLFHSGIISEMFKVPTEVETSELKTATEDVKDSGGVGRHSRRTRDGKRVLVKRQIERSRKTGGLSMEFYVQLAHFGIHLWKQNVTLNSHFRSSTTGDQKKIDDRPIPLLKLISFATSGIELGVETTMQDGQRRLIIKVCASQIDLEICNFTKTCMQHLQLLENNSESLSSNHFTTEEAHQPFHLLSLVSFGSFTEKDILVRVEERRGTARSISFAADLDVGGSIALHIHEIETVFLLIVESLLMPTEAKISFDTPAVSHHHFKFPDGSIGSLLTKLIGGSLREEKEMPFAIDFSKKFHESDSFHHFMDKAFASFLPANTDRLLLRLGLEDFSLHVPHTSTNESGHRSDEPWLAYKLKSAHILSTYLGLHMDTLEDDITKAFGKTGMSWNELLLDCDTGFYHQITALQELYSAELVDTNLKIKNSLIDSFDVGVKCTPRKIDLSLGESTLSLEDLANVKILYYSLRAFLDRFMLMQHRVSSVIAMLTDRGVEPIIREERPRVTKKSEHTNIILEEAESSLQRGRICVEEFFGKLQAYDSGMRACVQEKEEEIQRLRAQIFLKERSRIAALALVSCQAAGWLRVGGMHIAGERSPTVANMWRYYAVLRKSLLILYSGPGQARPLDVIYLVGAHVLELAGGKRKIDIKDGFGIKERRTNCVRFFLAPNGSECEMWTNQIYSAINTFSPNELSEDSDSDMTQGISTGNIDEGVSTSRSNDSLAEIDEADLIDNTNALERGQKMRERLNQVTASARSIGSAIQARRQRVHSQDSESPLEIDEIERSTIANNDEPAQNMANAESVNESLDGQTTEVECFENSTITSEHQRTTPGRFNKVKASTRNLSLVLQSRRQRTYTHDSGSSEELVEFGGHTTIRNVNSMESLSEKSCPETLNDDTLLNNSFANDDPPNTLTKKQIESKSQVQGNRFASMRSSAKNKLGTAMQGAREKALAVAEERRRRKQDREVVQEQKDADESNNRKSLRLRDRLENAANNVKNKIEQNEMSPTSKLVEQGIKTENAIPCQSLGSETPQTMAFERDPIEEVTDELNHAPVKEHIRNKISQIGSAVKNVRQPNQSSRPATTAPTDETAPRSSRFSIRRGNLKFSEESDMVKLKAVRAATGYKLREPERESTANIKSPLAKIKGNWLIHVSPEITKESTGGTSRVLKSDVAQPSKDVLTSIRLSESVDESVASAPSEEDFDNLSFGNNPSNDKLHYAIKIISNDKEKRGKMKILAITRDFNEVIALFIDVMESVALLPHAKCSEFVQGVRDATADMEKHLASSLGLAPLDIVQLTGDLLGGLLSASSSFHSTVAYQGYLCEVLSEFLNATLSCPLPMEVCIAVLEFLELVDAGTVPVDIASKKEETFRDQLIPPKRPKANTSVDNIGDILALRSACLSHLSRAAIGDALARKLREKEADNDRLQRGEDTNISPALPLGPRHIDHLTPSGSPDILRTALQEVLMQTMKERDEIQAHLLASSLMHAHQIECERKNVDLVKKKLSAAEEQMKNRKQGLFPEKTNDNSAMELQRHLEQHLAHSEQEIYNLNKQIAQEVSEKHCAILESERLKQMQALESKNHASEIKRLSEELREARKKLEATELTVQENGIEKLEQKGVSKEMIKNIYKLNVQN